MQGIAHAYAVTFGISDPVALALIALATGVIPTINILVTWWTGSHAKEVAKDAKRSADVAAASALDNREQLGQVKGLVNGQMDNIMRENMNLRTALRVAHDSMARNGVPIPPTHQG